MKYLVDLFCGIGGVSTGFAKEGFQVHACVDMWKLALKVHEDNHPKCKHFDFPLGTDEAKRKVLKLLPQLNKDDTLHIHASPPCQNLSTINSHRKKEIGLEMTIWTLSLLHDLSSKDPRITWTIEQVSDSSLIKILNEIPGINEYMFYNVFQLQQYGVSQQRKRLIISNVDITKLTPKKQPPSIEQVLSVPRNAKYISNSNVSTRNIETPNGALCVRDLKEKPVYSYTILSSPCWFFTKNMERIRSFTLEENTAIQTLPKSYFDKAENTLTKKDKSTMIANCVPPVFAGQLAKAVCKHHQLRK